MYKNRHSDIKTDLYRKLIHQYELELDELINDGNDPDEIEFLKNQIKELNGLKSYLENWTMGD